MKKLAQILLIAIISGCNLFEEKCDHAPDVYENGEIYSDRGECNFIASPGFGTRIEVNFNYGAVQGKTTNFRWKFSTPDFYIAETGEHINTEYLTTDAAINVYSIKRDGVRSVVTDIEVVAFNDCGESNPYNGKIEIVHEANATNGSVELVRAAVPVPVRHHGQAVYKGDLYILFGQRTGNDRNNYKLNLATNQWTTIAPPFQCNQRSLWKSIQADSDR